MGKKLSGRNVGRLPYGQYKSKRFSDGACCWISAYAGTMGKSERRGIRQQEVSVGEWTAVGGLVLALLTAIYSSMRFMVKSIMRELSPNGGNSLKDQVSRIEQRLDQLMLEIALKK
jgi:hypothetical protein